MRRSGIAYLYTVTRIATGQCYVGLTIQAKKRWYMHCWLAKAGRTKQLVHKAIRKYGQDAFRYEIIACARTWEAGAEAERQLIEQFGSYVSRGGYNLTLGGEGLLGCIRSPETRARISTSNTGRPGRTITDEEKAASRERLKAQRAADPIAFAEWARQGGNAMHGRKNTDATKKRMSDAALVVWQKRREMRYGREQQN